MLFPKDRTAHTIALDGPVVDHWLEQKIAQTANASAMQGRSTMQEDPNLYSRVLYRLSYVTPLPTDTFMRVMHIYIYIYTCIYIYTYRLMQAYAYIISIYSTTSLNRPSAGLT